MVMKRLAGSVDTAATSADARSIPPGGGCRRRRRHRGCAGGRGSCAIRSGSLSMTTRALPAASSSRAMARPHTSPATHDGVIVQCRYSLVHPTPLHRLAEVSLDQQLEQDREGVQGGAHAGQDQQHREDLAGTVERLDLPETDRRDGGDRLIDGVEDAEAE